MTAGRYEVDSIMTLLSGQLCSKHYNRIYEAVDVLLRHGAEQHARRLVEAVHASIAGGNDEPGED